ncbi:hypothetical protein LOTGIDRAFT_196169 [Lottia gigantea]|uniref:Uncharacterized protein n=1 Tax=Lottia gigantea TaxID=225164 RepID=V3Z2W5_LOTGI|nr:hypothetical protein LOTGIDRAFT_196169 [Lottia gigantea]ESO84943.1 hypothetical protein LOTGIDRAFT_196169 [Lottia gigantea]
MCAEKIVDADRIQMEKDGKIGAELEQTEPVQNSSIERHPGVLRVSWTRKNRGIIPNFSHKVVNIYSEYVNNRHAHHLINFIL